MKARAAARPTRIQTRSKTRARKSIDDDFAPSVTPSTADSDFPRWYSYHPPKDKTWWPKQHLLESPEPEDPKLKIHKYPPIFDPSYRPRRSTGGSTASDIRAATRKLKKMKTRSKAAMKSGTQTESQTTTRPKHKHITFKGPRYGPGKQELRSKGAHCGTKPFSKKKPGTVHFAEDTFTKAHAHKLGTGAFPMTIADLPASPVSPRSIHFPTLGINARYDNKPLTGTIAPLDDYEEYKKRNSSSSSTHSAGRVAFEAAHGNHGRRLGSVSSLDQPLTPKSLEYEAEKNLRRFSETMEATRGLSTDMPSTKRQPTAVEDGVEDTVTAKKRRLELIGEEAQAQFDSLRFLLHHIQDVPLALTLEDVGPLFTYLQTHIQNFSETHFDFTLTPEQQQAWPMHKLPTKYLPLMLIAQYIADGSQYTWQRFFTNSASRSALVYGIIGEWLKQRVFNHTCFGMSAAQVEKLEDMDREYLHHDAFLRSKKRARMVKDMLDEHSPWSKAGVKANEIANNLNGACDKLAEELMTVLTPLLPTSIFSYDDNSQSFTENKSFEAQAHRTKISTHLSSLIKDAAVFHRAIRVLGRDGTIVRIAPSAEKNTRYYDTAPFVIVNNDMLETTKHHGVKAGAKEEGKIKIKMTCFARVEAYVPHGPDYEEMCQQEKQIRDALQFERKLSGDVVESENDNDSDSNTDDAEEEAEPRDGFTWTNHAEKVFPPLPEHLITQQERKYGKGRAWTHGSYVSIYPRLAPHQVYCEWATPDEEKKLDIEDDEVVEVSDDELHNYERPRKGSKEHRRADREFGVPVEKKERLSLKDAVRVAREDVGPWKHAAEDRVRAMWNGFCRWEGALETVGTVGFAVWFFYSLSSGGCVAHVPEYLRSLVRQETWVKMAEATHAKALSIEESVLRVVSGVLGKVEEEAKLGQKITKKVIVEEGKEKLRAQAAVGTTTVRGVVPGH